MTKRRMGICRIHLGESMIIPAFGVCVQCLPIHEERAKMKRSHSKDVRLAVVLGADEAVDQKQKSLDRQMRRQRQVYQ